MRVTVYAPGADGNVAPTRTIEGPNTGLDTSMFLAFDAAGNLYVANLGQSTGVTTVTVYPPGVIGDARPLRTLVGPKMSGVGNIGNAVAVDAAGNVYMTDFDGSGILPYRAGAARNAPSVRKITGSDTQLEQPKFIAVWPMGRWGAQPLSSETAAGTKTVTHLMTFQPKSGNQIGGSAILQAIGTDASGNHGMLTQGSNNADLSITCTSGGGK